MKGLAPILVLILLGLVIGGATATYVYLDTLAVSDNFIINGTTVYVNNDQLYLSASPHTIHRSQDVIFELVSKQYTGEADVLFGFDYPDVKPMTAEYYNPRNVSEQKSYTCASPYWYNYTLNPKHFYCWYNETSNTTGLTTSTLVYDHLFESASGNTAYWTETHEEYWSNIANRFDYIDYEYEGMTRWYYTTFNAVAGEKYTMKSHIQVPIKSNTNRKYWVCIKPHSETIAQAKTSGHLYCLDPWWDSDYVYRYPIYNNYTTSALVHNVTVLSTPVWTKTWNESYIYSKLSGPTGEWAIANETTSKYWENETTSASLYSSGSGSYGAATMWQTDGVVAVYHMSAGANDSSNGINGTFAGAAASSSTGKFANSLVLDGTDDWISVADNVKLDGYATMSLSAWVNADAINNADAIMAKWMGASLAYYLAIDNTAGKFSCYFANATANSPVALSSTSIATGSWYHVACTYDGSNICVYINGVKNTTCASQTGTVRASTSALLIGEYDTVGNREWDGYIDEVRIYNRSLSDTEVKAMYYAGLGNLTTLGAEELITPVPQLTAVAPTNTTYYVDDLNFNVTSDLDADYCGFDLDATGTYTDMANTSLTDWGYAYTGITPSGSHTIEFYCNTTDATSNTTEVVFSALDTLKIYGNTTGRANLTYSIYETMDTNITVLNYTGVTVGGVWFEINNTNYTATSIETVTDGSWIGAVYNYSHMFTEADVGTVTVKQFAQNDIWEVNKTNTSTQFTVTVNKWDNNTVTLTSSAGWLLNYGDSTTLTCSDDAGSTMQLTVDGVVVSNPYSAALGVDSYSIVCTALASANYSAKSSTNTLVISESQSGCTNTTTFLYTTTVNVNSSQVVMNFTDLVNNHIVRNNLGDVSVITSGVNATTNFTDGTYLLLNTVATGTATVRYGNYYVNSPPAANATKTNTPTSFVSTQLANYWYLIQVNDEMTLVNGLPINTTDRITLYCDGGSQEFNITDEYFMIPTFRQMEQIELTARYSADELYFRDLLFSTPVEYRTIYMADGTEYQIVQYVITLMDNTGDYTDPEIHIKKLIGSDWVTITERPFDVENKAIVYLIAGQQYQISITSGTEYETNVGNLQADTVNLAKTVVISDVYAMNTTASNINYSLTYDNTTGVIQFLWRDYGEQTDLIEMSVYNYSNTSQLMYYVNSSNTSYVSFTYTTPTTNHKYLVDVDIHHEVFGENTWSITEIFGNVVGFLIDTGNLDTSTLRIIGSFVFIVVILLFSPVAAGTGAVIVAILGVLAAFLFPDVFSITLMTVALALAILNKFIERKVET